ncbi:MAG: polysaccharide pyruvyl transferase family protein, partial [Deltaproteobacteria bacterium]|nr:polysaccharide pyruvyl transferase family protein [Deltaproteobacteria bacterium]
VRRWIIGSNPYLREIDEADMAASIAGGDSFSDIYGLSRFFYVALPQVLILLMGKPLVQLPQTIGPFASKLPRAIARAILKHSSVIYSRDYPGLLETRKILGITGKNERIRFCYDMGFVLDPVVPNALLIELAGHSRPLTDAQCTVGLNVSGLLFMGGYTRANMFGLKADYRELVGEIIEFLINRKKARVVLVPHVFGGPEHTESDSTVCERLYSELKPRYGERLSFLSGTYDQGEIKHMIGMCDFFIGSRMHACIAALSQCIPAVPIAYSRKFIGVMESIEVESYVADPCALETGAILDIIDKAFEDRTAIAEKLRARMPAVKEKVLNLFREIQD